MSQLDDLLQSGIEAHRRGDGARAESLYRRALGDAVTRPAAARQLGALMLDRGEGVAALDILLEAVSLAPDSPDALRDLGRAWAASGQPGEAVACLTRAADLRPGSAEIAFYLGCACRQMQRLDEAAGHFRRAAELQPRSAEAWNNYGAALAQSGRYNEAARVFRKAVALRSDYADAHRNLGAALRLLGDETGADASDRRAAACVARLGRAAGRSERALKVGRSAATGNPTGGGAVNLSPGAAQAHYQRGRQAEQREEWLAAEGHYRKAVETDPKMATALAGLGMALVRLGRYEEAVSALKSAISMTPRLVTGWIGLGAAYELMGRPVEADAAYERVIALEPSSADAHNNLGNTLQSRGRFQEAISCYRRAIALRPDHAGAHTNLGNALVQIGRLDEAVSVLRRAVTIDPGLPVAHGNLGNALLRRHALEEAERCMRAAVKLNPRNAGLLTNLGLNLRMLGRHEKAGKLLHEATRIDPGSAEAHGHLALHLLQMGRYREGWMEYEWRVHVKHARESDRPRWHGEPLEGRRLLVTAEQGFGDMIQFVRCLALLRDRTPGKVVFECYAELLDLFREIEWCDELITHDPDRMPDSSLYDTHVPLMSLPGLLCPDAPAVAYPAPYLRAEPAIQSHWKRRMASKAFRAGLVWAGKPSFIDDFNRSCRLEQFAPLTGIPGVAFYGVQKGEAAGQSLDACGGMTLDSLGSELRSFSDTAGAIANLDVLISVDTSAAHLAGAMGARVWLLAPYLSDWRWGIAGATTPYYPTMRIFRQPRQGDWASVFEAVAVALAAEVAVL